MKCENCGGDGKDDDDGDDPLSAMLTLIGATEATYKVGNFKFCSEKCRKEWWDKHHIDTGFSECRMAYRFIVGMNIFIIPKGGELGHPKSDVTIFVNATVYSITKESQGIEHLHLEFDVESRTFRNPPYGRIEFVNQVQIAKQINEIIADKV